MLKNIQIKILDERVGKEFPIPAIASKGAAGVDLVACLDEDKVLGPGECEIIPTGFAMYLEDPNYAALVLPRSGIGTREGIVLGNLVGLIDSDYQGPLGVPIWNRSQTDITVSVGMRMAQMIIVPVVQAHFEVVASFSDLTQRGKAGFGSTGV